MVENVIWYLGGKGSSGYTADAFYAGERDSTSIYSGNASSITGYIGLMYASDYGYSVLSSSCARTTNLSSYITSACGGSSWLRKEVSEWTNTHNSGSSSKLLFYNHDGALTTSDNAYGCFITRPVLYLNSTVQKISGSGTITEPFKIGY